MLAPLTHDAHLFLAEGLGVQAARLPDGARHRAAVNELLRAGFIEYGQYALVVTPTGRNYYHR